MYNDGMRKTVSKFIKVAARKTGLHGQELKAAVKQLKSTWNQTPWNQRHLFRAHLEQKPIVSLTK